ncbi:Ppx/GppA phosphatase family protein [Patulibacter sp.]|uniref:Ppx/GppA phosphatase family protein n=1 Tax=Patulibacter sp. TaxID=1912859 RepID=UPI00271F2369|nr:Ppx/GppA phosphatase family protein [Patulibacter sp.]MDO9408456.1 Ppx/GppA phosphatase family protein [Patulibacter sp.]
MAVPGVAGTASPASRRAVVDLGSNTFRMVVYAIDPSAALVPGGAWRQTAELYEPVRIGADLGPDGELQPRGLRRAFVAIQLFDHFCRSHELTSDRIDAVATSAIREAPNQDAILDDTRAQTLLRPRVLSQTEEAAYGHVAAINSTTLHDGGVLDIGGGSMQLARTRGRHATDSRSWRLGAVRTTEQFLQGDGPTKGHQLKALRRHVEGELAAAPWVADLSDRLVGVGGAVRNLATAARNDLGKTDLGVQGVAVDRDALGGLIEELAALPPAERGSVAGVKPSRADVILGAAVTIDTVLHVAGLHAIEATEFGLREGVLLDRLLAGEAALGGLAAYPDVRDAAVRNLAFRYDGDPAHSAHVEKLALELFDGLTALGVHEGSARERSLVSAAAALHDIGMAVGYDDHHKHGRYLLVTNGLPGFSPAETAVVGQAIRYHRKGNPTMGPFRSIVREGDDERLLRMVALLRMAEGMERGHDGAVRAVTLRRDGDRLLLHMNCGVGGAPVARWAAEGQAGLVRRAFGMDLEVTEGAD